MALYSTLFLEQKPDKTVLLRVFGMIAKNASQVLNKHQA